MQRRTDAVQQSLTGRHAETAVRIGTEGSGHTAAVQTVRPREQLHSGGRRTAGHRDQEVGRRRHVVKKLLGTKLFHT